MKAEELEKYIGKMIYKENGGSAMCVGYSLDKMDYPLIAESNYVDGWMFLDDTDKIVQACEFYEYAPIPTEKPAEVPRTIQSAIRELEASRTIQPVIRELEEEGYVITRVDNGFMVRHPEGGQTYHDTLC